MTERNPKGRAAPKRRLTLLAVLVVFVFLVLLISVSISSVLLYVMSSLGLLQPLSSARLPFLLSFLLIVSLVVGVLLTTMIGNRSLRPLKKFVDATKEIAAGNFTVRVDARGPEEYSRLATSFNEMAQELSGIETLREDFVSSISHEYKTPIVSIRGFAKLLKKGNLTQTQRDEYLDIIIEETDRLAQLSGNVLLLSRLSADQKPDAPEVFSLDEQLRRVVLTLHPQMEKKRLALDIDLSPCNVSGNQELLQQVWVNLLHNAMKFTPEGGGITLLLANDGDRACVTVADTGIGIAPEAMRHIFDKFYQADASRSGEGNGLGLALVRQIVTLHGGEVEAQSTPGKGSTFTVCLPVAPPKGPVAS